MTQLTFTGHNIEVTDAIKELVSQKFEKIKRHFDNITTAHFTMHVEKLDNIAEMTLHIPGHQLHAKANSDDMYKSIDKALKEIDRQVIKHKEKAGNHRD